jgi:flagellar motor switch protein FliM
MSTDEFLTKDEVDALKEAMNSQPESASLPRLEEPDEVLAYQLGSSENTITGILPILEAIHERFSHRLRVALFELLHRDVEIIIDGMETRGYSDFIATLEAPSSVNIITLEPLNGPAMVVFEKRLVFAVVDLFFGGHGRMESPLQPRDFTTTETRFIQRLLNLTSRAVEAAWEPFLVVNWKSLGSESNPQFVTAINPQEVLQVVTVRITLHEDVTATLYIALPCSMLESGRGPLLASLRKEHASRDKSLAKRLRKGVENSEITVRGVLAETELTVYELLSLKVGDFIPIEVTTKATLEAEGIPVYVGQYGVAQGRRALQIDHKLTPLGDQAQEDAA